MDGETNLKEKTAPIETSVVNETLIFRIRGDMACDVPNADLDFWNSNITMPVPGLG